MAILEDAGVSEFEESAVQVIMSFLHSEMRNLIESTIVNAKLGKKLVADREEVELGVYSFMEQRGAHPHTLQDETQLAREINKFAVGGFPTHSFVNLPPNAFVSSNWQIAAPGESIKQDPKVI
eukprot:GHVP01022839.1.p1 GENE.GHVP01022839.1~~GHVP01022839.1.p1  ORF type:complete len:136 (-),score=32.62 GHVP01022839.1:661-1029(-)